MVGACAVAIFKRQVSLDEKSDEQNMGLDRKVEVDLIRPGVHASGVGSAPDGRSAGRGDVQ